MLKVSGANEVIVRHGQLQPHEQRLDPARRRKTPAPSAYRECRSACDPPSRATPVGNAPAERHRAPPPRTASADSFIAMSPGKRPAPFTCSSVNSKFGISTPGFTACGLRSQSRRFSGVLSRMPAPNCARLAKCVRSGPTWAFAPRAVNVVAIHAAHLHENLLALDRAWPSVGGVDGRNCACSHAANSAGGCATTVNRIHACSVPQNSEQLPG